MVSPDASQSTLLSGGFVALQQTKPDLKDPATGFVSVTTSSNDEKHESEQTRVAEKIVSPDLGTSVGIKTPTPLETSHKVHRERLIVIYKVHNPSKLEDVEKLLKTFKGREKELFAKVTEKYNLNSHTESSTETQVQANNKAHVEDPKLTEEGETLPGAFDNDTPKSTVEDVRLRRLDGGTDKERLVRFYEKYNPTKLEQVDRIVEAYQGQSDLLYKNLLDKYNEAAEKESSAISATKVDKIELTDGVQAEGTPLAKKGGCRERLVAIYEVHNPSKVKDVNKLLNKFKGREEELFSKVTEKYKLDLKAEQEDATPALKSSERNDPTKTIRLTDAELTTKVEEVDMILEAYEGQSDAVYQGLLDQNDLTDQQEAKTGSDGTVPREKTPDNLDTVSGSPQQQSPEGCTESYKESLIAFYTKHNPTKLSQVDQILEAYRGNEEDLKKLVALNCLLKESKVEEAPFETRMTPEERRGLMHRRLTAFYEKHNPSMVDNVDKLLESYKGREHLLFRKLRKNYNANSQPTSGDISSPMLFRTPSTPTRTTDDSFGNRTGAGYLGSNNSAGSSFISDVSPIQPSANETSFAGSSGKVKDTNATTPMKSSFLSTMKPSTSNPFAKIDSRATSMEQVVTAPSTKPSFLSPVLPSACNPFAKKASDDKRQEQIATPTTINTAFAVKSSASNPFAKKDTVKPPSDIATVESSASSSSANIAAEPVTKEGKPPPNYGKSSLTMDFKPMPPPQSFVSPVKPSASNPFATKQQNDSPISSKTTEFLKRVPVSSNNPFVQMTAGSSTATDPNKSSAIPFSKFGSVSSSGTSFLDNMKASTDNPFGQATPFSFSLTTKSSSFLEQVKPSMTNPFAPGSPVPATNPSAFSFGLQTPKSDDEDVA